MATIQQRIKERRLAKGMTLLELAEQLGVKEATVQRYESGEIKNIKHNTIQRMAEVLDCSPAYLMGWEDELYSRSAELSPSESSLLNLWRGASEEGRQAAVVLLRGYQLPENRKNASGASTG